MSMNRKVQQIKALKLSINREVWRREELLEKHGEENEKFFKTLKALYLQLVAKFEIRAANKAIILHKSLAEAKEAQKAVK